jgi:hypothetical protein
MKKITIVLLVFLALTGSSFGKEVTENRAKAAGQKFLDDRLNAALTKSHSSLQMVYKEMDAAIQAPAAANACFYVFNNASGPGFVIVSADDRAMPVLAYSLEKPFNADRIPPHVAAWLDFYRQEIGGAIARDEPASPAMEKKWEDLESGTSSHHALRGGKSVNPLVQTLWDQSPNYNALCPYDNQYGDYTVTGCVATGMAQVMKYWNAPATGSGFHSYNSDKFGTLSADFGNTTYQWTSMPNQLSGANNAVATLMFHCGVSVDMTYGVGQTGGSSAYVVESQSPVQNCAEYALKTYFGYKASLAGKMRDDYSLSTWQSMLKTDLDASRPVLYAGIGDGGGHCFVCDGYDDQDYFHFNWGWSGSYNGYFQIDALNPEGVGTGGGNGGFNNYQQAVFGVEPTTGGGQPAANDLRLYSQVTPSATQIYYGATFSVNAKVGNFGTNAFTGDFCAAIFNNNNVFVGMVDSIIGQTLPSLNYFDLTFSNDGLLTMLPGTYTIGLYYRPTGNNWYAVADGDYQNYIQMSVINPNDIELYAPMNITPGLSFNQGATVSVTLDVVNDGSTDFNGLWDVSLYDLDGYFVKTIDSIPNENLPVGYHYTNGLTFTRQNVNVPPGTYLLAMQYLKNGASYYELTGSTNYENPVEVTVLAEVLNQDVYEPDNTVETAYSLPVNFTGTQTEISTTGSNCHVGNDYDYYKLDLPAGYSYVMVARVYDAGNPLSGQDYTLDAIFAYSADGNTWSDTYDSQMAGTYTILNGGTLYFGVAPKFTGQTGTYLLSIGLTRNAAGIEDAGTNGYINIYPNPATDRIMIDLSSWSGKVDRIDLADPEGRIVSSMVPGNGHSVIAMDVSGFAAGLYYLETVTPQGIVSKKIVIRK